MKRRPWRQPKSMPSSSCASPNLESTAHYSSLPALLKSSAPVELTESETEYVVSAVKHIFREHIVLQHDIKNMLPETVLAGIAIDRLVDVIGIDRPSTIGHRSMIGRPSL
jgi:Coatomer gamma subunit appendage platform subdomain